MYNTRSVLFAAHLLPTCPYVACIYAQDGHDRDLCMNLRGNSSQKCMWLFDISARCVDFWT